jgi:hypothetical protein
MRITIFIVLTGIMFLSCNKDKFTNEPQISFKSFRPNTASFEHAGEINPYLIFEIRDGDGDIGMTEQDTAMIFIKNLLTNDEDSFNFPDLASSAGKDFKGDVEVAIFNILPPRSGIEPRIDTLTFEVYVKDFAKNKSNVITAAPFYFYTP